MMVRADPTTGRPSVPLVVSPPLRSSIGAPHAPFFFPPASYGPHSAVRRSTVSLTHAVPPVHAVQRGGTWACYGDRPCRDDVLRPVRTTGLGRRSLGRGLGSRGVAEGAVGTVRTRWLSHVVSMPGRRPRGLERARPVALRGRRRRRSRSLLQWAPYWGAREVPTEIPQRPGNIAPVSDRRRAGPLRPAELDCDSRLPPRRKTRIQCGGSGAVRPTKCHSAARKLAGSNGRQRRLGRRRGPSARWRAIRKGDRCRFGGEDVAQVERRRRAVLAGGDAAADHDAKRFGGRRRSIGADDCTAPFGQVRRTRPSVADGISAIPQPRRPASGKSGQALADGVRQVASAAAAAHAGSRPDLDP